MLAALTCILIAHVQDALHLGTGVVVGVQCLFHAIGIDGGFLLLTEIHTAGEFADADKVGATHDLVLQGRLVYQALEGLHGADVGIEAQLLAHGQQTLFGAHLGGGVVVKLGVAHAGKEHSIGLFAYLEGLLGERVANLIYGMSTTKGGLVTYLVAKLLSHGAAHGHALLHNLRTYSVARKDGNFEFHILWTPPLTLPQGEGVYSTGELGILLKG